jgi:hypothetical protein
MQLSMVLMSHHRLGNISRRKLSPASSTATENFSTVAKGVGEDQKMQLSKLMGCQAWGRPATRITKGDDVAPHTRDFLAAVSVKRSSLGRGVLAKRKPPTQPRDASAVSADINQPSAAFRKVSIFASLIFTWSIHSGVL